MFKSFINIISSQPVIIASLISGLIALVLGTIQSIISYNKNNRDNYLNFETLVKEKLEKIYCPLNMCISKDTSRFIVDDAIHELIRKNSYLLSTKLLKYFKDLINIESKIINKERLGHIFENDDLNIEHKNLKKLVLQTLNSEFTKLQTMHNKNFISYEKKFKKNWFTSLYSTIIKICAGSTLLFYIILLSIYLSENINKIGTDIPISSSPLINVFFRIYAIIIILTTLSFFLIIASIFASKISNFINKKNKFYSEYEFILETGYYKCATCGCEKKLFEYDRFPRCSEHKTLFKKIFHIFRIKQWIFISKERSVKIN